MKQICTDDWGDGNCGLMWYRLGASPFDLFEIGWIGCFVEGVGDALSVRSNLGVTVAVSGWNSCFLAI